MKFKSEKMLHEVIRDLPEAQRIENMLNRGYLTIEDALTAIADVIRSEKEKERSIAE